MAASLTLVLSRLSSWRFRQATERLQALVANVRVVEIQFHQLGQAADDWHALVGDSGADQRQLFQVLEGPELVHRRVGYPRVIEQESGEPSHASQYRESLVTDVRTGQVEPAQSLEGLEVSRGRNRSHRYRQGQDLAETRCPTAAPILDR